MLSIRGSDEVKAAALIFQRADRETRRGIQRESRAWAPQLQRAVASKAREPVDRAIAASGRVSATTKGLRAVFGSAGRLSSGEALREVVRQWEFGTGQPNQWGKYLSRSPRGRAVRVTRHVQRQVPRRADNGRLVYPAVADVTPELVARWVRACAEAVRR